MEKSFEDYLRELQEVVMALENKDISLDLAVENYTKGLELSKKCFDIFKKNEDLVVKQMDNEELKPFTKVSD